MHKATVDDVTTLSPHSVLSHHRMSEIYLLFRKLNGISLLD
jgi:hypothetical protein